MPITAPWQPYLDAGYHVTVLGRLPNGRRHGLCPACDIDVTIIDDDGGGHLSFHGGAVAGSTCDGSAMPVARDRGAISVAALGNAVIGTALAVGLGALIAVVVSIAASGMWFR